MELQNLLKTATTDSLYMALGTMLTVLRTRGDVTIESGRISMEYGETYCRDDGVTFGVCYYAEGSAELAMEERDPPALNLEKLAEGFGMTVEQLTAYIDEHKDEMIASGNAHYARDGALVIDGEGS